jgi:phospholipase C
VHDSIIVSQDALQMSLSIDNAGAGGAPFVLVDQLNGATNAPRKYAIHSGKSIQDTFDIGTATAAYSQSLHGPNGFVREFNGS